MKNSSGVYLMDEDGFLDFIDKMAEFYGSEVEVVSDDKGDSRIEEV